MFDVAESLSVCDLIGQYDSIGSFKIGLSDVSKSLLSGGVPYLQFDAGGIDFYGFEFEVYSYGGYVAVMEDVITIFGEQIGLTDSAVSDYNYFGQKILLFLAVGH